MHTSAPIATRHAAPASRAAAPGVAMGQANIIFPGLFHQGEPARAAWSACDGVGAGDYLPWQDSASVCGAVVAMHRRAALGGHDLNTLPLVHPRRSVGKAPAHESEVESANPRGL